MKGVYNSENSKGQPSCYDDCPGGENGKPLVTACSKAFTSYQIFLAVAIRNFHWKGGIGSWPEIISRRLLQRPARLRQFSGMDGLPKSRRRLPAVRCRRHLLRRSIDYSEGCTCTVRPSTDIIEIFCGAKL